MLSYQALLSDVLLQASCATEIEHILKTHVPNAKVVQDVGTDIVFCLPEFDSDGNRQRENFPALFDELDAKLEDLGLDSYGVSDTTLEEVNGNILIGSEGLSLVSD